MSWPNELLKELLKPLPPVLRVVSCVVILALAGLWLLDQAKLVDVKGKLVEQQRELVELKGKLVEQEKERLQHQDEKIDRWVREAFSAPTPTPSKEELERVNQIKREYFSRFLNQ